MNIKKHAVLGLLLLWFSLIWSCGKKDESKVGELKSKELAADSSSDAWTIKPKAMNYDSLLIVLSDIVEAIQENPTDLDYRHQLVAAGYDSAWGTIVAPGFGRPQSDAETSSIAAKYAERAAIADALRWAAWIKRWSDNPSAPLDTLKVEIQQHRVVAKKVLPDHSVSVLIEVHRSHIL